MFASNIEPIFYQIQLSMASNYYVVCSVKHDQLSFYYLLLAIVSKVELSEFFSAIIL